MAALPPLALFALFTAWSYYRGHRAGFLVLWAVMLGISLASTSLGQGTQTLVVRVLGAVWAAILGALNGVAAG